MLDPRLCEPCLSACLPFRDSPNDASLHWGKASTRNGLRRDTRTMSTARTRHDRLSYRILYTRSRVAVKSTVPKLVQNRIFLRCVM